MHTVELMVEMMEIIDHYLMMDFMSILVKHILKMLLKIYNGFCVTMDFPYELLF